MSSNHGDKTSQIADRRLIEYFVIVSSVEQAHDPHKKKEAAKPSSGDISFQDWKTESSFDQDEEDVYAKYQFKPTVTARYPLHDHPDNPLHDNVIFFCHPSGRIQLRTEEYMPKVRYTILNIIMCHLIYLCDWCVKFSSRKAAHPFKIRLSCLMKIQSYFYRSTISPPREAQDAKFTAPA